MRRFFVPGRPALARAVKTGALPADAPSLTAWNGGFDAALSATEDVLQDAANECDRIVRDKPRDKMLGRLDAAIADIDAAADEEALATRALDVARALGRVAPARAERPSA